MSTVWQKNVLMVEVSGVRVRCRPRFDCMDGAKVAKATMVDM